VLCAVCLPLGPSSVIWDVHGGAGTGTPQAQLGRSSPPRARRCTTDNGTTQWGAGGGERSRQTARSAIRIALYLMNGSRQKHDIPVLDLSLYK
jgi:hypothetical protein